MKINKNNYEAWFIDYFDGALSTEQIAELMLFLNANPKFKEEFDSFEIVSLTDFDDEVKFPGKKNLKKNEPTIEELMVLYVDGTISEAYKVKLLGAIEFNPKLKEDLEHYKKTKLSPEKIVFENKQTLKSIAADIEMLMSMNVEGTLSDAEKIILQKAISKNPALKKEQDLYNKTKLDADTSIFYPNKNSLKREKEVTLTPLFFRYAAAAAVALLVGIYLFMKTDVTPNAQYITFIKRELNYKRNSIKAQENILPENNNSNQYVKKTHRNGYPYKIKQTPADTTVIDKNNVVEENEKIVKVNTMDGSADSAYKKMVLVSNFDFETDDENTTANTTDYLTWKELMALKVKEKMLPEQIETNENATDSKKFTWYDLALIGIKGINKILKNDIALKKRTDEKGTVVAYQFVTPKNEYNFPVK